MDWAGLNDRLWLSMLPAVAVAFAMFMIAPNRPRGRMWQAAFILAGGMFCLVGLASLATTILLLGPGKPLLDRIFEDVFTVAGTVLMLGVMMFWLRRIDRFAYGLVEIASALIMAGYTAWAPDGGPVARVLALLAAIYIVVRGCDNLQIGYSAERGAAKAYRSWQASRSVRRSRNIPEGLDPRADISPKDQSSKPPSPSGS